MGRRVVVTGLGMVSPLGNDVATSWEGVLASKSGVANITDFDTENLAVKFAASVKNFEVEDYMPKKEARKFDAFIQYGVAASDSSNQVIPVLK